MGANEDYEEESSPVENQATQFAKNKAKEKTTENIKKIINANKPAGGNVGKVSKKSMNGTMPKPNEKLIKSGSKNTAQQPLAKQKQMQTVLKRIAQRKAAQKKATNAVVTKVVGKSIIKIIVAAFPTILPVIACIMILIPVSLLATKLASYFKSVVQKDEKQDNREWLAKEWKEGARWMINGKPTNKGLSGTIDVIYDNCNEYDKVLLDNKAFIDDVFKDSYKQALSEAEKRVTDMGASWTNARESLKLSNSESWQYVYQYTNYAHLISCVNLGFLSKVFPSDGKDFDPSEFKKVLRDKNNQKYFYQIIYSPVKTTMKKNLHPITRDGKVELDENEEELFNTAVMHWERMNEHKKQMTPKPKREDFDYSESKDVNVTIRPYTYNTLYDFLGVEPNDDCMKDVTYFDMQNQMANEVKELSVDVDEALGLNNELVWDYSISSDSANGAIIGPDMTSTTNVKTVWNYLKAAGWTDAGAAGMMGNIEAESRFVTNALSKDGNSSYGLCQWTSGRRKKLEEYASQNNLDVKLASTQCSYLINVDFDANIGKFKNNVVKANDPVTAADYVCLKFERPSNYKSKEAFESAKRKKLAENPNHWFKSLTWERFGYSKELKTYGLDLNIRQQYAQKFYDANKGQMFEFINSPGQNVHLSKEESGIILKALSTENKNRQLVAATAISLLGGVPYEWGGKSTMKGKDPSWGTLNKDGKAKGLDCSGYVQWVFRTAGYYEYDWKTIGSTSAMKNLDDIKKSELQVGDLGLLKKSGDDGTGANHVGIYIGNGYFIHCNSTHKTVTIGRCDNFKVFKRIPWIDKRGN